MWGAPHPITEIHICTISSAANKRRGQTKVFPLLLFPLLFLSVGCAFFAEKCYPPLGYCWHTVK